MLIRMHVLRGVRKPRTRQYLPQLRRGLCSQANPSFKELEGRQLPRQLPRKFHGEAQASHRCSSCGTCHRSQGHAARAKVRSPDGNESRTTLASVHAVEPPVDWPWDVGLRPLASRTRWARVRGLRRDGVDPVHGRVPCAALPRDRWPGRFCVCSWLWIHVRTSGASCDCVGRTQPADLQGTRQWAPSSVTFNPKGNSA